MAVSISVVTPSYNQGQFLEETLRSVLCQRDQVHEYFVIDGGSTDSSVDVIKRYASGIDYWVSERDKGQSDAILKGFSRATGDVVCWLNSDDVLLPGALQKVRAAFEQHPEWDVLTGYHARIDADSRIVALYRTPRESHLKFRWGIVRVCQQACFFRRRAYEAVGGLNRSLHFVMDFELWSRMFDAGAKWGHIPEFLAGFRWHATAKTSAQAPKFAEESQIVRDRHPQFNEGCLRQRLGTMVYRSAVLLSGRYPYAMLQTRHYRGRKLTEVFGDWVIA